MGDQAVGRRAKGGVPGGGAIERSVDIGLQVLDAHAHGERLAFERDAAMLEEGEDVARGVTAGEDDGAGGDVHGAALVGHGDAADGAARIELDVGDLRAKAHLSAVRANAGDDVGDDLGQDVRADVRLGVPEDVARRARLHQRAQDEAMQGIFGARVELAVGERAGPAQPELDVGRRIELAGGVEMAHGARAPGRVVPLLDEKGRKARLGEGEGGKEPRASRTHHDGALVCVWRDGGVAGALE